MTSTSGKSPPKASPPPHLTPFPTVGPSLPHPLRALPHTRFPLCDRVEHFFDGRTLRATPPATRSKHQLRDAIHSIFALGQSTSFTFTCIFRLAKMSLGKIYSYPSKHPAHSARPAVAHPMPLRRQLARQACPGRRRLVGRLGRGGQH